MYPSHQNKQRGIVTTLCIFIVAFVSISAIGIHHYIKYNNHNEAIYLYQQLYTISALQEMHFLKHDSYTQDLSQLVEKGLQDDFATFKVLPGHTDNISTSFLITTHAQAQSTLFHKQTTATLFLNSRGLLGYLPDESS